MSEVIEKPKRKVYMVLAAMILAFASIFATSTPAQAADARWVTSAGCPSHGGVKVFASQYGRILIHAYDTSWRYLGSKDVRASSTSMGIYPREGRFSVTVYSGYITKAYSFCW